MSTTPLGRVGERNTGSCGFPPETVGPRVGGCGIVESMYDQLAKETHVALRTLSRQLIVSALIQPVVWAVLLGTFLCALLVPFGISLTESIPYFIGAATPLLALVQICLILTIGFALYLCFVSYQNWTDVHGANLASRLFFKILKSAGYWISQILGRTRVIQSPNMTSRWFAYPERAANQGTRYLPGVSPQLE